VDAGGFCSRSRSQLDEIIDILESVARIFPLADDVEPVAAIYDAALPSLQRPKQRRIEDDRVSRPIAVKRSWTSLWI
jgi:hypothetical protein